jgi:predicted DNA-binding transcriptional regulator AlpA
LAQGKVRHVPGAVKLSAGVTAWKVEDLRAWMAEVE